VRGLIYDGQSARGHAVEIAIDGDCLVLTYDNGAIERVPSSALARGITTAERLTVHRDDLPDWRLVITQPAPPAELTALRPLRGIRKKTAAMYGAVSALVLAGALGLWFGGDAVFDVIVPMIPHSALEKLGNTIIKGIGGDRQCNAADGQAALDRLLSRLKPPQGFAEPIRISVADSDTINAFAAPGGHIVILRGLIDQAKSADEVAGVVAHEITHVQLRHPTKALIRAVGVSTLMQALGGQTGAFVNQAVLLSGSRDAERAADAGALELLARARISPAGMADFFRRMEARKSVHHESRGDALIDRLGSFMATHPGNEERVNTIAQAGRAATQSAPAMLDRDWESLRAICSTHTGSE
jgi:hypothetical protein